MYLLRIEGGRERETVLPLSLLIVKELVERILPSHEQLVRFAEVALDVVEPLTAAAAATAARFCACCIQ